MLDILGNLERTHTCGVLRASDHVSHAGIGEPAAGGLSFRPAFDCATPVLPALRRQPGFVF